MQVGVYLRQAPGVRSAVYLGVSAAMLELLWRVSRPTGPYAVECLHVRALPFVAIWTYTCVCLRSEDYERWNRTPLRQGVMQSLQGIGLGASAFLAWVSISVSQEWVSIPNWGWESNSPRAVARSLFLMGAGHLAIAWNEEMVFRGYGFETVQTAIGRKGAIGLLIPLFAIYHGIDFQKFIGMAAGGIILTLLRLHSDALWLPIGYHWAWNVTQLAIFGPVAGPPSVRPLHIHGPPLWVGRPGLPESGLLSTIIALTMALIVWLWTRRKDTHPSVLPGAT